MTRFLIVRHGESEWNAVGRIQGHSDVDLSPAGIEQARRVSERLKSEKLDAVYSSDLRRASMTAEIIAEPHGVCVVETPLLREAYLGEWEGLMVSEVAERYPDTYTAYTGNSVANRPPGAERIEDLIVRCTRFLNEAVALHPSGTVAVAAHGGSVRGIIAASLGVGPEIYRRIRLDNCGLTLIEVNEGLPSLVALNDTCHLEVRG